MIDDVLTTENLSEEPLLVIYEGDDDYKVWMIPGSSPTKFFKITDDYLDDDEDLVILEELLEENGYTEVTEFDISTIVVKSDDDDESDDE